MLYGWLSANPFSDTAPVLAAMAAALRTGAAEDGRTWTCPGFGIGLLEPTFRNALSDQRLSSEPALSVDGLCLWMTGEAFDWPSNGSLHNAGESRGQPFRRRLLDALRRRGPQTISDLDG